MIATPAVLVIGTAVSIGAWMGYRYLVGERNGRGVAALHLLLGAGGLEVLVLVLRGAPNGDLVAGAGLGEISALVLAGALLTGLFIPIIAKPKPGIIGASIALHATLATLGFGMLLIWALGVPG